MLALKEFVPQKQFQESNKKNAREFESFALCKKIKSRYLKYLFFAFIDGVAFIFETKSPVSINRDWLQHIYLKNRFRQQIYSIVYKTNSQIRFNIDQTLLPGNKMWEFVCEQTWNAVTELVKVTIAKRCAFESTAPRQTLW